MDIGKFVFIGHCDDMFREVESLKYRNEAAYYLSDKEIYWPIETIGYDNIWDIVETSMLKEKLYDNI